MAVVQLLEFLAEPPQQSTVSAQVAQLLEAIGNYLPEDEQVRLDTLRDRCEWGELTEAEHQELIGYEDLLEQQRVERLQALIELAKIRNIDLMRLNEQASTASPLSNLRG
jgi:hypothetical protein